jgi:hypothetical protein
MPTAFHYVARVLRDLRRQPSAVVLAAQLAGVVLYPFMEGTGVGRALFSVFGIAILGLVVRAVRSSAGLTWLGVLLGAPATVLLLIQAVTGSDDLLPYSSALEAVLYFYAAGGLIAYMLADHDITRDEIYAVGATFTLVAWAFAYTYVVCQAIWPGSFTAEVDPEHGGLAPRRPARHAPCRRRPHGREGVTSRAIGAFRSRASG